MLAPLTCKPLLGFSSAFLDMAALGFLGLARSHPLQSGDLCGQLRCSRYSARGGLVTFPSLIGFLITVLAF